MKALCWHGPEDIRAATGFRKDTVYDNDGAR